MTQQAQVLLYLPFLPSSHFSVFYIIFEGSGVQMESVGEPSLLDIGFVLLKSEYIKLLKNFSFVFMFP